MLHWWLHLETTTAAQTQATEPDAADLLRRLTPEESGAPVKRFLRTGAGINEEDRVISITVPFKSKKLAAKLGRLARYHVWILSKRKPAWVLKHYPKLFKGYAHFYVKRMH
ncbi:hypothetical protein P3T76_001518 [Phytophthora citrophthora]|uniref:Uncharacterized protein n=1 Tax=Phytophthora citrophthora TaxID=4793 RepID=A0AAD9H0I1_9STRA|nr:hypothetical protein P3T76_001518 [Phytophthora citrophthora]